MGNGVSSGREKVNPPSGINQINEQIWIFNSPEGIPDVEIIFFHGLQLVDFENAFWKTWLDVKEQVVWPKDWLSKHLLNPRILSVSYNSSAMRSSSQPDMYQLGENLVEDIIQHNLDIGQKSPVFLVGHCLGGIAIKQFLLSALHQKQTLDSRIFDREINRINTFFENFKGVFYYATPHAGSKIIDLARLLPNTSPILKYLSTLDSHRARINDEFMKCRRNWNVRAFAVAEGKPFSYFKRFIETILVEEGSARQDVDQHYNYTTADHFTVCKARDQDDPTVIKMLARFILRPDDSPVIGRQSKMVKDFITELKHNYRCGWFVCKIWLSHLDMEVKEEILSVLKKSGYRDIYETGTTKFFERMKDDLQVPTA